MPAAVALPIAMAASSGMQMAGNYMSNRAQSKAYDRQLEAERYSLDQQLQLERERAAEERRRYDEEAKAREPYEALRMNALLALGRGMGLDLSAFNPGARAAADPTGGRAGYGSAGGVSEARDMMNRLAVGGATSTGQRMLPAAAPQYRPPQQMVGNPLDATMAQLLQQNQYRALMSGQ